MSVDPFPFATLTELKQRWPDFPAGADEHAETLLDDASEFIVDMVPAAVNSSPGTRRRVVCAVVRRSMEASLATGSVQTTMTAGPFNINQSPANPHGDFYLTKNEKKALGHGQQKAFSVTVGPARADLSAHRPWCSLMFGATYCSCGADIAGEPIYEG